MPTPVLLLARELNLGGSERQMTEIARGLDRSRFRPHVACFFPEGLRARPLREAGVPILHLPVESLKSTAALVGAKRLSRYVREQGIEIVHAFDYPMNVFAIPVARYFTRAATLASQRAHRDLTPPLYARLQRMTDAMADGVVVNCDFVRRHLVNDYGIREDRIHLCLNGIDLDTFCRGPQRRRSTEVIVGTVCAMRPEKSTGTLLEAFAMVRSRAAVRLRIIGDGPELPRLRRRAEELGITSLVDFQPATEDVAGCLRAMDIFVLPSLSEALSNSLMEAMACGCASIASHVGGNPELIRHEETGLLFPAGNAEALGSALSRLIEDESLASRVAAAGHDFIHRNFSQAASARRMAQIYETILNRRARS